MPIFDQQSLAKAVSEALTQPDVPLEHRGALLLVADDSGVKTVIAAKIANNWRIQGELEHPWSGGLSGGVQVKATW